MQPGQLFLFANKDLRQKSNRFSFHCKNRYLHLIPQVFSQVASEKPNDCSFSLRWMPFLCGLPVRTLVGRYAGRMKLPNLRDAEGPFQVDLPLPDRKASVRAGRAWHFLPQQGLHPAAATHICYVVCGECAKLALVGH